jgi:hypothetical protein
MLREAYRDPHPMHVIDAAIALWPLDPQFRKAQMEWPFLYKTDAADAVEGLTQFLARDPQSPDAIRLRMIYESRLGLSDAARADAQRLQKFTSFVEN